MNHLAAKLTTWHMIASDRLETALSEDRGDGPTDNGLIIAGGVAAGAVVVSAVAAAVANHTGKIK